MAQHQSGYPTTAGGTSFNPEFSSVVQQEFNKNFSREGAKMRVLHAGEYAPGTLLRKVGSGANAYFTPITTEANALNDVISTRYVTTDAGAADAIKNSFTVKSSPYISHSRFVLAFLSAVTNADRLAAINARFSNGTPLTSIRDQSTQTLTEDEFAFALLNNVNAVNAILVGPGKQDHPTQMVNFKNGGANDEVNVTVLTRGPAILLRDKDKNSAGQGGIPLKFKGANDDDLLNGSWIYTGDKTGNEDGANTERDKALEGGITAIGGSVKVYGRDSVLGEIVGN